MRILANRPYDALVRDLIADQGLWTDHPATNFVSVTYTEETKTPDPERLAARVSRAFLGVRLDCAQCHDHPFQPWKQADFRGLAAFFGGVYSGLRGIRDQESTYKPLGSQDQGDRRTSSPRVPFLPELAGRTGTPREQLAGWIVNPANPNSRPRHGQPRLGPALRPAAGRAGRRPARRRASSRLPSTCWPADFSSHGYDLHRLIRDHRRHRGLPARQRG